MTLRILGVPVVWFFGSALVYGWPRLLLALGWQSVPIPPDWACLALGGVFALVWWERTR